MFVDFDDVVVLKRPAQFSGREVSAPDPPAELLTNLLHPPAVQVLSEAVLEHEARVVITSSWLRFMKRDHVERLFREAGSPDVAERLHAAWDAPQRQGETRAAAIDRWLLANHRGEEFVILDDDRSGTGLRDSAHFERGRVVLCRAGIGLHRGHLASIRRALAP
jgi:hypothetical protein